MKIQFFTKALNGNLKNEVLKAALPVVMVSYLLTYGRPAYLPIGCFNPV